MAVSTDINVEGIPPQTCLESHSQLNLTDLIAMRPWHVVTSEVRADDNFMNIGALDSNEICMRYKKNQAHPMNLPPFRIMKIQSRKD